MMSFFELALLLPCILLLCSAQKTFYVKPTMSYDHYTCPVDSCLSFVEHAKKGGGHLENATLVFLSGDHYIESNIEIRNLMSLTLVGQPFENPLIDNVYPYDEYEYGYEYEYEYEYEYVPPSTISFKYNIPPTNIRFECIENLSIKGLRIDSGGYGNYYGSEVVPDVYGPVVVAESVQNLTISNCHFYTNQYGGALAVLNTIFKSNYVFYGDGVYVKNNSTANFIDNFFYGFSNTLDVEIDTTSTATFINNEFTGYAIYGSTNNTPSIYYVKPSPDTPCPQSPCNTLSEYLRMADQYFTLNTTLVLLPGDHLLEDKLLVRDISALTLIRGTADGDSSRARSLSATATRINCTSRTVFFHFQNISEVSIKSVGFMSCGNDNSPAMSLVAVHLASISNCTFQNSNGGALYVKETDALMLTHSSFIDNFSGSGGAVKMLSNTATFEGNTTFRRNSVNGSGGAMFIKDSTVHFSGMITFESNTAMNSGGAVYAEECQLNFEGENIFKENTASRDGGGLLLTANSKYSIFPNTTISFANNTAMHGGAIKVDGSNQLAYCVNICLTSALNECFFQLNSTTVIKNEEQLDYFNVTMDFNNNTAGEGGSDIYGGVVDNCELQSVQVDENSDFQSSGSVLDYITGNTPETLHVSSVPLTICFCENNETYCNSSSITKYAYPGGKFNVSVIALGQRGGRTSAVIQADLTQHNIIFDCSQYIQNINNTCSDVEYTVFSSVEQTQEDIILHAQGPCPREGRSLQLRVVVQQCPFHFPISSNGHICNCSDRLERFTDTCFVQNKTILRPRDASFWVGYEEEDILMVHSHCPFDYCTSEELYISLDNSDMQCNYNRTGKLCGECIQNLSLVLGSSRCLQCSNSHLTLLIAFSFAGIALVFFLFLLKLTVAIGTINGLIFYANVVQVNSAVFFPPSPSGAASILTVFIAWLNLDLGIETCFYDGMDAYAKTWLQFLFPVYLWTLVGTIILFSHFSQTISRLLGTNPIAVLCTLFLLSYAKVLRTIIAALSFASLDYSFPPYGYYYNNNETYEIVWLLDGNVKYLTGRHIPLFVVALSALLFLFLPYSLLLFCGQWLQGKSNLRVFSWVKKPSIKSILDAYHAPYAGKHRYWTGLLLLARLLIFAFNILGDPAVNLFSITAVTLAIVTIGFVAGIYANQYFGALEASFVINLGILAAVTTSFDRQAALTYTSVSIAFVTFIGIVVYHSHLQLKDNKLWMKIANLALDTFHRRDKCTLNEENNVQPLTTATKSEVAVSLREPLLEDEV